MDPDILEDTHLTGTSALLQTPALDPYLPNQGDTAEVAVVSGWRQCGCEEGNVTPS